MFGPPRHPCPAAAATSAAKSDSGLLDSLTESIAHKTCNLYRRANLALSFLEGLADAFLVVEDERLFQQRLFLVEGLQTGFGDLLDHRFRFALLPELVGEDVLLALDDGWIDPRRIDSQRVR